jgi:hypothetical protein
MTPCSAACQTLDLTDWVFTLQANSGPLLAHKTYVYKPVMVTRWTNTEMLVSQDFFAPVFSPVLSAALTWIG